MESSIYAILVKAAERSESNVVTVEETEVIELSSETALIFVTTREASSPNSSTQSTRTLVVKTSNGGASWRETLDAPEGAVVLDELFLISGEDDTIQELWFITQWQVEATFPTLYWTSDSGETWQSSSAIHDFLVDKGHVSFNYADGLRFRNKTEGIVIARALNIESGEEDLIYFLQTQDSGKTWKEIQEVPKWYFQVQNAKKILKWRVPSFHITNNKEQIFIGKMVGSFPLILKFQETLED
ncbi:MAG: hypothetical protein AB1589_22140 [Cyanobacteriota bacterium]